MIPQILHQIWIGPNQMPDHIKRYCDINRKIFYDYEYKFWCNENIPDMPDKCKSQMERYGKINKYAFQADILRYYLLNQYGGIYLDVDFLCSKRFDNLITKSFFCVNPNRKAFHVCNGVFACLPNNPILTKLLNELKDEPYHGPLLLTMYISEYIGVKYKTNILSHLKDNPNDYLECGQPEDFFSVKGYCFHNALKSWIK
jgi:mannosyltransferase OCH1-like enzyme